MDVSNASGYDGTTVAADACYMAKHVTGRTKVVLSEALNPQVRQVVKTYAPGFGLEVVEVPHRDGVTDPDELRSAAADAACVIFQQPNFFGCLEPAPDLAAAAATRPGAPRRARRPRVPRRARGAGRLRLRARPWARDRARELPVVRRPALRLHRGALGVHPPDAGPDRRRDDRPRGRARLCPDLCRRASSTSAVRRRRRTSRRTRRCSRSPGSSTSPGSARRGCASWGRPAWPSASTRGAVGAPARVSTRDNVQGVCRPRRTERRTSSAAARERGVHPGYALGRDYAGLDDALLVAVTEKRTPERTSTASPRCSRRWRR